MYLTNSNFPTPQGLSGWLKPRLPSDSPTRLPHGESNPASRTSAGKTSLVDSSPPLRTVDVVTVIIIGKENHILAKSRQELPDGRVRDRFRPFSEKIKPGEDTEEAPIRAMKEELGSIIGGSFGDCGVVKIAPGSYQKKVEERNLVSHPARINYGRVTFDAWVEGLLEMESCTEVGQEYEGAAGNRGLENAVPLTKHYWKWVLTKTIPEVHLNHIYREANPGDFVPKLGAKSDLHYVVILNERPH